MTYKEMPTADTQLLLDEYYKYAKKEKDVKQQLKCIQSYLGCIDYVLRVRNHEYIKKNNKCLIFDNWWKARE